MSFWRSIGKALSKALKFAEKAQASPVVQDLEKIAIQKEMNEALKGKSK